MTKEEFEKLTPEEQALYLAESAINGVLNGKKLTTPVADGGIYCGPTFGLMGDYGGGPLSKLKSKDEDIG